MSAGKRCSLGEGEGSLSQDSNRDSSSAAAALPAGGEPGKSTSMASPAPSVWGMRALPPTVLNAALPAGTLLDGALHWMEVCDIISIPPVSDAA